MKRGLGILLAVVFAIPSAARAQSQADDEAAVRQVPVAFAAAWAKHDGHQLALVMAEDVDFINMNGEWLHGRADFERIHSRLLQGRFKQSLITPLEVKVRFLRPDLALLHWNWTVRGDRNQDGTARRPRYGVFTMVVERRGGVWLVAAAQNTGWVPPPDPDPEMEGIHSPIAYPGQHTRP